jgi:hypothetical protein
VYERTRALAGIEPRLKARKQRVDERGVIRFGGVHDDISFRSEPGDELDVGEGALDGFDWWQAGTILRNDVWT